EKGDLLNTKKSLKLIIETEGESLDAVDENGNGFLLFALSLKKIEIAEVIFEFFLKENKLEAIWIKNNLNQTILHLASGQQIPLQLLERFLKSCSFNEDSSIEEILENMNQLDKKGKTPIHYACYHGIEDTVNFLLEKGARLDIQDNKGQFAINLAVQQGHVKIVKKLLVEMQRMDVNFSTLIDIHEETLLHVACRYGYVKIVKLLLEHGLNPYLYNTTNHTALDLCISSGLKAPSDKQSDYGKILILLNEYGAFIAKNLPQEFSIYLDNENVFGTPYAEPFYLLDTCFGEKPVEPLSVKGIFSVDDTLELVRKLYKEKRDYPPFARQFQAIIWHCRDLLRNKNNLSKHLLDFCTSCINLNDTLKDRLISLLNTPRFFKKTTTYSQIGLPQDILEKLTLFKKNEGLEKRNNSQTQREFLLQLERQTDFLIGKLQYAKSHQLSKNCDIPLLFLLDGLTLLSGTLLFSLTLVRSSPGREEDWMWIGQIISGVCFIASVVAILGRMSRNYIIDSSCCANESTKLIEDLEQIKNSLTEANPFHQRLTRLINELIVNDQGGFTPFIHASSTDEDRVSRKIALLQDSVKPLLEDIIVSCNSNPDIKLYHLSNDRPSSEDVESNDSNENIDNYEHEDIVGLPLLTS
ncbi:TPA: ankyrin repeat domain-containing protein, partial [Legionella anisa]